MKKVFYMQEVVQQVGGFDINTKDNFYCDFCDYKGNKN